MKKMRTTATTKSTEKHGFWFYNRISFSPIFTHSSLIYSQFYSSTIYGFDAGKKNGFKLSIVQISKQANNGREKKRFSTSHNQKLSSIRAEQGITTTSRSTHSLTC